MSDYNFHNINEKKLEETVRIDNIKKTIAKETSFDETQEYNANTINEVKKSIEEDERIKKLQETVFIKDVTADLSDIKDTIKESLKEEEKAEKAYTSNKKIILTSILGGIVVFIFIFLIVFMGVFDRSEKEPQVSDSQTNQNSQTEQDPQTEPFSPSAESDNEEKPQTEVYATLININDNSIEIYNWSEQIREVLAIDEETNVFQSNGGETSIYYFSKGDIVLLSALDNNVVASVKTPEDAWELETVSNVMVEDKNIIYNEKSYSYDRNTLFLTNEKDLLAEDISPIDKVTLKGMDNHIFTVKVEEQHGEILLEGADVIEELEVFIDDEKVTVEEGVVDVVMGTSKITVTGSNMEEYISVVTVEEGESTLIDLKEFVYDKNSSRVTLSIDESDYEVKINNQSYDVNKNMVIVPKGNQIIEISKNGFHDWSMPINLTQDEITIRVDLVPRTVQVEEVKKTGSISIASKPGFGEVYVNGEYVGITPVLQILEYGDHEITVELDGFEAYNSTVTINSPEKWITANFE